MIKRTRVGYLLLAGAVLLALLSAGQQAASAQTPAPVTTEVEPPKPAPTGVLDAVIPATRTPVPTATPDLIAEGVELVTEATGLAGESFLGLKVEDWLNLVISILVVAIGYLVGTWLILSILRRLVRRTETDFDDRFLEAVGSDVRWLVTVFTLDFATQRLIFFGAEAKALLADVYFLLGLVVVVRMAMNLIGMADEEATKRAAQEGREDELAPVITLLMRVGRVIVLLAGIIIFLSRLGIDATAFAAALGLGGLAVSATGSRSRESAPGATWWTSVSAPRAFAPGTIVWSSYPIRPSVRIRSSITHILILAIGFKPTWASPMVRTSRWHAASS